MGFDPASGSTMPSAFEVTDDELSSVEPNLPEVPVREMVTSAEEYKRARKGSIALSGAGWGYTASGSVTAAGDEKLNASTLAIYQSNVIRQALRMVSPGQQLRPGVLELLENERDFRDKYGSHFIAGYVTGGTFTARYVYEFSSAEVAQSLKATFKGSFKGAAVTADADASFTQSATDQKSSTSLKISASFVGAHHAVGADPDKDLDALQKALENWNRAMNVADYQAPKLHAIVKPWTALNVVSDQWDGTHGLGPGDQTAEHAADAFLTLDYIESSIASLLALASGDRTLLDVRTKCLKLRRQLSTHVSAFFNPTSESDALERAESEIEQIRATVDGVFLPEVEGASTFRVEVSAQFGKWAMELREGNFATNSKYESLKYLVSVDRDGKPVSPAMFDVRFGERRRLARFRYADKANYCMAVGVDADETGRLRVQAYFGDDRQMDNAFDNNIAVSQVGELGTKETGWTPKSHAFEDANRRDIYVIRARIDGPASPLDDS